MTEAEWLQGSNPAATLDFLKGKVDDRKLRLFAVACASRVWDDLRDERHREAIRAAERFAGGEATQSELKTAFASANHLWNDVASGPDYNIIASAARTAETVAPEDTFFAAQETAERAEVAAAIRLWMSGPDRNRRPTNEEFRSLGGPERQWQSDLLREVFGNPFRPVAIDPAWVSWRDGLVLRLAVAAYLERRLPGGPLDHERFAILADALEEAGCNNADILSHLRGPGPHVRGCWALDLLTDRG